MGWPRSPRRSHPSDAGTGTRTWRRGRPRAGRAHAPRRPGSCRSNAACRAVPGKARPSCSWSAGSRRSRAGEPPAGRRGPSRPRSPAAASPPVAATRWRSARTWPEAWSRAGRPDRGGRPAGTAAGWTPIARRRPRTPGRRSGRPRPAGRSGPRQEPARPARSRSAAPGPAAPGPAARRRAARPEPARPGPGRSGPGRRSAPGRSDGRLAAFRIPGAPPGPGTRSLAGRRSLAVLAASRRGGPAAGAPATCRLCPAR